VHTAAIRLNELRISANEDRLALELELGRQHELVGELGELVAQYPLRERLRGQLMLALYRSGRTAEALRAYQDARRTMINELGIEPSAVLQRLERAILVSDPALDAPGAVVPKWPARRQVPRLLPTDLADFTGRDEQMRAILAELARADGTAPQAVPVAVIVGKSGVGKTSLAVHASHAVVASFTDGQLYADLHGASNPAGPTRVLERFLRALGVSGAQVPDSLDERAEMYRNMLAERKVLVVLDDARDESDVLPLLPGSGSAAVIITSRSRLSGLAGAVHIEVNVFDTDKSLGLLGRIAGGTRVRAQAEDAAAIAEYCGHLPLALRIAGARLAARPHWTVRQLALRLANETGRLDELQHGNMGIRSSLSLIYESTSERARQLFRRLPLLDLPAFSSWLGAALLDVSVDCAEELFDDLVSAQLIEATSTGSGSPSQYRFHDLIRVFARERLAAEESVDERRAAFARVLGTLLFLTEEANRRYYGGAYVGLRNDAELWPLPAHVLEPLIANPLAWYERERVTLALGVRQAAQAGFVESCWSLALNAVTLFEFRCYFDDWQESSEIALEAARRAHDVRGQAAMLYSFGSLYIAQQRFDAARQVFNEAVELFRAADDDQGMALVVRHIAFIDRMSGRLDEATKHYEQALATFRRTEDKIATAYVLHSLAQVRMERDDLCGAMRMLSEALELCRAAHCVRVEAQVLHRMGEYHLLAGALADAIPAFDLALARTREIDDPIGEAYALQGIGVANIRSGDFGAARDALLRAAALADSIGESLAGARALLGLSELALASGDPRNAVIAGKQASDMFRDMGVLLYIVRALDLLGEAYAALGDADAAKAASGEAEVLRAKLAGSA
jgi:tetratricopeptide (TPR) repeat protein